MENWAGSLLCAATVCVWGALSLSPSRRPTLSPVAAIVGRNHSYRQRGGSYAGSSVWGANLQGWCIWQQKNGTSCMSVNYSPRLKSTGWRPDRSRPTYVTQPGTVYISTCACSKRKPYLFQLISGRPGLPMCFYCYLSHIFFHCMRIQRKDDVQHYFTMGFHGMI